MQQNATVLFKFRIPELDSLPQEDQQRVLTSCWDSDAVQAAWRRYWSRPQQLPLIPIFPIAIYSALANIGFARVLLVSLPIRRRTVHITRDISSRRFARVMAYGCYQGRRRRNRNRAVMRSSRGAATVRSIQPGASRPTGGTPPWVQHKAASPSGRWELLRLYQDGVRWHATPCLNPPDVLAPRWAARR
jgi:hypothetical protein